PLVDSQLLHDPTQRGRSCRRRRALDPALRGEFRTLRPRGASAGPRVLVLLSCLAAERRRSIDLAASAKRRAFRKKRYDRSSRGEPTRRLGAMSVAGVARRTAACGLGAYIGSHATGHHAEHTLVSRVAFVVSARSSTPRELTYATSSTTRGCNSGSPPVSR